MFVGGIQDLTSDELGDYFSEFGRVEHIKMGSKPFGFITFVTAHEAVAAYQGGYSKRKGRSEHKIRNVLFGCDLREKKVNRYLNYRSINAYVLFQEE